MDTPGVPHSRSLPDLPTDRGNNQSSLQHTSRAHYRTQQFMKNSLTSVRKRKTHVSGSVFLQSQETGFTPLKGVSLALSRNGDKVGRLFTTKEGGLYKIEKALDKGLYHLCIESEQYGGCAKFLVTDFEINNLQIIVKPKEEITSQDTDKQP